MVNWRIQLANSPIRDLANCALSDLAVSLSVSLFERRAIVAFVELAIAVPVVVVVVAVTVALRTDRIEAVAVARVVAPGVESVAVADLRRIVAVAAARCDDSRVPIDRTAVDAATVAVRARDTVVALTVADLESLTVMLPVERPVAVAPAIPVVCVAELAVPLGREAPVSPRVVVSLFETFAIAVIVGAPLDVPAVHAAGRVAIPIGLRRACRRRNCDSRHEQK